MLIPQNPKYTLNNKNDYIVLDYCFATGYCRKLKKWMGYYMEYIFSKKDSKEKWIIKDYTLEDFNSKKEALNAIKDKINECSSKEKYELLGV
jgi:hypothetical protein